MKKLLILAVLATALTGCGKIDRAVSAWSGNGSEVCQGGVIYLQFTSGVSVKYRPDGRIATCTNAS